MLIVKICEDKQNWQKNENSNEFLQSWEWGEFKQTFGQNVLRLQIFENEKVKNQLQGFEHKLLGGINYYYFPRVSFNSQEEQDIILSFLKNKCSFVRIEPTKPFFQIVEKSRNAGNRQPANTWIIDLEAKEEEILKNMHSKTRYNIGVAKKAGVVIKKEKNEEIFWGLLRETSTRHDIKNYDRNYYKKILELPFVEQLTAFDASNKPIASNILVFYKDVATYLYGASSYESRNLMATYLLQWQGLLMSQEKGFKKYDFWGIAPVERDIENTGQMCFNGWCWDNSHKWSGITRFKLGFGGYPQSYEQAKDIVFDQFKYGIYKLAHKFLGK